MACRGDNLIGGRWCPGNGEELTSENPATGEVLWKGKSSTADDVGRAVAAAREAARAWARATLDERIGVLQAFQSAVEQHRDRLAEVISREVGKPNWEAATEVSAMIAKIPVSIDALQRRRAEESFDAAGYRGVTRYKPHGVLAVFGPFNFPGHISNGHIAPALLAGNTVVFKPSELTPLVSEVMIELWLEAGLPEGVINLVQGARETGIALVDHPGHNGVLFTGSLAAGLSIGRALAGRPEAIVALELGGNNPLVVDDVSNVDAAVYHTIQSAYVTSGQRCTCARRLIVPAGNDAFIERLVESIPRLVVGAPADRPEPFLGPLIRAAAVDRVLDEQRRLAEAGAEILVEAKRLPAGPAFVSPGLIDVTNVATRDDCEVFGPLLQLIRVANFAAAVDDANRTQYGLVAGLLSDDGARYEQFFNGVNAGLINWNRPTTGASGKLPFGGVGRSGNHRPAGYFMIDACNSPVASLESATLTMPGELPPGVSLP